MADWTREWPTEPGWYWFHGNSAEQRRRGRAPRLAMAEAERLGDEFVVYVNNALFTRDNGWEGWWQRIPEPELPKEPTHA